MEVPSSRPNRNATPLRQHSRTIAGIKVSVDNFDAITGVDAANE